MDVFKEYIVKRELSQNERISKIFIIIAAVALASCCVIFTFGTTLSLFGILFAFICFYLGYQLIAKYFIEYEYIITNADLDIDKIVNQSKRKRLCTIDLHKVTACGKCGDDFEVDTDDTLVLASANNPELENYYLRFTHKQFGNAVLVFTPSVEFIELIKPFIPRSVKTDF